MSKLPFFNCNVKLAGTCNSHPKKQKGEQISIHLENAATSNKQQCKHIENYIQKLDMRSSLRTNWKISALGAGTIENPYVMVKFPSIAPPLPWEPFLQTYKNRKKVISSTTQLKHQLLKTMTFCNFYLLSYYMSPWLKVRLLLKKTSIYSRISNFCAREWIIIDQRNARYSATSESNEHQ